MKVFPANAEKALRRAAEQFGVSFYEDTRWDACSRVLSKTQGRYVKSLNFNLMDSKIGIVFYVYKYPKYPFRPPIWNWLYRTIPMFPFVATHEWSRLDELPVDETVDYYCEKIEVYVRKKLLS